MDKDIRKCKNCGKEYAVSIIGDTMPGCKEREDIKCPYCYHLDGYITTGGCVRTYGVDKNTEDK